jgi:hypothetical protein
MTDRDALIQIGNLVGAPTSAYFPEQERKQLVKRLQDISAIVQAQLGVPTPPAKHPDDTRQNPGIGAILNGSFYRPSRFNKIDEEDNGRDIGK